MNTYKQKETQGPVIVQPMVWASLAEEINNGKRSVAIYSTDYFRTWVLFLGPDRGYKFHYHDAPESFVVLSGTGRFMTPSEESDLKPGTIACVPSGAPYALENIGREALVLLGTRGEGPDGAHHIYEG